ncbi:hypothetical protein, partial [Ruminococcus sp.]|uniref:hypothetical protein n=1 Tax=Ruminococcus sp. TaxID=41978 RepID=UPI002E8199CB
MEKGIELWKKVLTTAMQLPGVKVNRDSFLKKELTIYCTDIQLAELLEKGTVGVIPIEILDKIASESISYHVKLVTASSTALGIPGGFAMVGTIPSDLAQYYYHVFALAQKLAYIYGYPDLCDENGNFTEDAAEMLTIFVGVMGGVAAANKVIQEIAEQVQKEVLRRLPRYALTKGVLYPLVKQIAKWVGINLTKQSFSRGVSKLVPIIGGIVSGGLTYVTFKPQS